MCPYIFKFDVVYVYNSPWRYYYYAVAALSELPVKGHLCVWSIGMRWGVVLWAVVRGWRGEVICVCMF
jgi:hypothetical protein